MFFYCSHSIALICIWCRHLCRCKLFFLRLSLLFVCGKPTLKHPRETSAGEPVVWYALTDPSYSAGLSGQWEHTIHYQTRGPGIASTQRVSARALRQAQTISPVCVAQKRATSDLVKCAKACKTTFCPLTDYGLIPNLASRAIPLYGVSRYTLTRDAGIRYPSMSPV